jgi:hypothetical protein
MLGVSLRLSAKTTSSDPCQLGPWVHIVVVCTRLFCMWSNTLKAHHRGFGRTSGAEVFVEATAEGCRS